MVDAWSAHAELLQNKKKTAGWLLGEELYTDLHIFV